jgi:D-glycero-D-manno-heptose 1,7-bisphosphate phosphatase
MVSPRLFQDFRILEGVTEAIETLCQLDYELVVVTNQPDISRGLMLQTELDQMTEAVYALGVQQVLICPHSDEDACLCRKPKPGLLNQYLESSESKPTELWMIGDREVDMRAGIAIGAKIILISKNRKDETTLETQPDLRRASLVIIKAL